MPASASAAAPAMTYTILNRDSLPYDGRTFEFEGCRVQDTDVSFVWVAMPPAGSVRLHKHPYQEIFIIQEATATFTVGSAVVEAEAGQIILVPAHTPHKFTDTGGRELKQVDIHCSRRSITEWLEASWRAGGLRRTPPRTKPNKEQL